MKIPVFLAALAISTTTAMADSPTIVDVNASQSGRLWRFDVSLKHADTGWDHYANGWGVYLTDGTELGYRVLGHPHVNEQPFTRSLTGVFIPKGTQKIVIIPNDSVHGKGEPFIVDLN